MVKNFVKNSPACRESGFTLIEILIVIVIISILAVFAYPNYQKYVIKTKRTEAMTELQNIAKRIEAQKLVKGSYKGIALTDIFGGVIDRQSKVKFPYNGTQLYTITIWDTNGNRMTSSHLTGRNWELRAWPKNNQIMKGDGTLKLNFEGLKCRANKCGLDDEWKN